MFPVFFDTCVLFKPYLCDTLLSIAEAEVFRPLWSTGVLVELRRTLARRGLGAAAIEHRLGCMNLAFPDAEVTDYLALVPSMTNDPKDRHVLAAAVQGGAEMLVTENVRDFPPASVRAYGIDVVDQDTFLLDQLDLRPADVLAALLRQVSRHRREPRTVDTLLDILVGPGHGCAGFASACRRLR